MSFLLLLLLALTGCSDHSDGRWSAHQVEESDFGLEITSPPDGASIDGETVITVSGTLEKPMGGELTEADIRALTVNDMPAEVDLYLGRWQAEVPLDVMDDVGITARLDGNSGTETVSAISVRNTPMQGNYELLRMLAGGSEALVYGSGQVRRVDLLSGAETRIVDGLVNGFRLPQTGIRIDATATNAYLLRWDILDGPSEAYVVELENDAGRAIGYLNYAGGKEATEYHGFDLDAVNMRLVFSRKTGDLRGIDIDDCSLLTISITEHPAQVKELVNTSIVSDIPGAPSLPFCPGPVVIDPSNNRAIVAADDRVIPSYFFYPKPEEYGLYAYDLATGEGSVLSDADPGNGPLLYAPRWLFLSDGGERVLAVSEERILWVDLATGIRSSALNNPDMPEGITDIDYDELGRRLLIASGKNRLVALHLDSGELETLVSVAPGSPVGSGSELPSLLDPRRHVSVADSERNQLYVLDRDNRHFVTIDVTTLERSSLAIVPSVNVSGAIVDANSGDLYVYGGSEIIFMEVDTGVTRTVTSDSIGAGIQIRSVTGLSLDYKRGLLYASGEIGKGRRNGLISIDIETGNRKLIFEVQDYEFESPDLLRLNLYDARRSRVIATTQGGHVVTIDVQNGQRSRIYTAENDGNTLATIAWDSTPGQILVGVSPVNLLASTTPKEIRSIDLVSGTAVTILKSAVPFSFDAERARIYAMGDLLGNGRTDQAFSIDRYTGGTAVIARGLN